MPRRPPRHTAACVGAACLAAALVLIATDGYMRMKAAMAGVLIEHAWSRSTDDGRPHRPWNWADMHPLALLEVERLGERCIVLTGAGGESLAFGIGHVSGTATPNHPGNCVLAGHRSTTMSWLGDLRTGDRCRLTTPDTVVTYRVAGARVVDRRDVSVLEPPNEGSCLTLVTCYPLDGILPGNERYVVTARPTPPVRLPDQVEHGGRIQDPSWEPAPCTTQFVGFLSNLDITPPALLGINNSPTAP